MNSNSLIQVSGVVWGPHLSTTEKPATPAQLGTLPLGSAAGSTSVFIWTAGFLFPGFL